MVRTPKNQLTFLASDDKQDDASDMLQFLEVLRNGQNWAKKLILSVHFESLFVYLLVHPMRYIPRFCQLKDLIKVYICGKFHYCSICGYEIKNFQSFLFWFIINEMVPFWDCLGPLPQILFDLAETSKIWMSSLCQVSASDYLSFSILNRRSHSFFWFWTWFRYILGFFLGGGGQ